MIHTDVGLIDDEFLSSSSGGGLSGARVRGLWVSLRCPRRVCHVAISLFVAFVALMCLEMNKKTDAKDITFDYIQLSYFDYYYYCNQHQ